MSCPADRRAPWAESRAPMVPRAVGLSIFAAFLVLGTFGAAHAQPWRRPVDAVAVLLVLAGPVALVLLRRGPRLLVGVVAVLTLAYLLAGCPYGPMVFTLVVAVVIAIAADPRGTAWVAV